MDTNTVKTPAEVNVKLKKQRRRRRGKMKANKGHFGQKNMDQKDKNMDNFESGENGMIAKDGLQDNLLAVDLATKLSQEHPKQDVVSTTNPLEKSAKSSKERRKKAKKKAESKRGPQSMDHTDMISNLSLSHACNGHTECRITKITAVAQESRYLTRKSSAISLSGPCSNLAQKDGNFVELCRNDHRALLPTAVNASSYNICPEFSRERLESGTRGWNKEVTEHTSSEVINEARNHLLALPYQIPERRKYICSRRKLLILDVNGLLADIVRPPPRECKADANIPGCAIFKRPFCCDFLKFCFERFDVGIWSSRSKKIIDKVVEHLLGDLKHKLLFCWDMFYCTESGSKTLENRYKPMVFKELRKLWEKHDSNLPWEEGDYDESNTLLLDDSPYKALLNPVSYHHHFYPISGRGGDLRVYLEGLATAENVQHYVAQNPFGQGAINETNHFWSFYSRVLNSFFFQSDKRVTKVEYAVTLDKDGDCEEH